MHHYDNLSPDKIISAVESIGIVCDARLLALNSYENRVYQVGVEDGEPLIAKFYRDERWSDQQILEEHQFSIDLAKAEISVVAPYEYREKTLFKYETFRFALFSRMGGHSPELENENSLKVLGRTLGRIHSVGSAGKFDARPELCFEKEIKDSHSFLLEHFVPDELKNAYETLIEDLTKTCLVIFETPYRISPIRIHGDCHVGNILWRNNVAHFVDFDDCLTAPAIQDLWMFLNGQKMDREFQLSKLIEGYTEFCDFDISQIRLIEALRTRRVINYAAWLGKRWSDPAFPRSFPWFNTPRYWSDHILELREQLSATQEEPLRLL